MLLKIWRRVREGYLLLCESVDQEIHETDPMAGSYTTWCRRMLKLCGILSFVTLFRIYEYDIKLHMRDGFTWIDEQRNYRTALHQDLPNSKIQHIFSANKKECLLDKVPRTNWSLNLEPAFKMDPDKFLYPILKNEPIDQLMGLRQAILLALKLNRTLVLPQFHHHNRPSEHLTNPAINADLRVDVDILRTFISTVPLEAIRETCNDKFDAVLLTGELYVPPGIGSLEKAQRETEMQIFEEDTTNLIAPAFPRNLTKGTKLRIKPNKISKYYDETSEYRCALHPFPLTMIDVEPFLHKAVKLPQYPLKLEYTSANTLYSSVWYYTQQPQYIISLATEIVHTLMNAHITKSGVYNFICVHHHKYTAGNKEINVPSSVISAIVEDKVHHMQQIGREMFDGTVAGAYVAAPQSMQDSTQEIKEELAKANIKVFTGSDILAIWAHEHFGRDDWLPDSLCSLVSDYKQDVLTMVEMQLCMDSAVFIRSVASSWAANVQAHRIATKYSQLDDNFADILLKIQSHKQKEDN